MAKSLLLHIGDPKTGSSSIQEVMRNRLWVSPDVKVAYPEQLNSFPLANAISDPKQADQCEARYSKLGEWLGMSDADADEAVVSAEQFFRVDPQALLDTLMHYVPAYVPGLRIVAYVRPHASRFLSAFMQRTKAGMFQGDMETFFARSRGESLLYFAPRFDRWRAVFGDRFTLRPMIRSQLRDGDVVPDFLDLVVKGAPFTLRSTVQANPSLPLEYVTALRDIQTVLKRNTIQVGTRHAVGDHLGRALAAKFPGAGTKLQLSAALYEEIAAQCLPDAQALDAAFFDAPLMTQALTDAANDVTPASQPTDVAAHYSPEAVQTLRQSARKLVAMFKKRPGAWTVAYEREIGQRITPPDATPPPPPVRMNIDRVNGVLADLTATIGRLAGPQNP